jgi:hypothetical protein
MADESEAAVRKTVSLPASFWKRVEDYRFGNRIRSETEAVRRLIELGLASAGDAGGIIPDAKAPRRRHQARTTG